MKPVAKKVLNTLVEDHMTEVIRDSITIQRHCKRPRKSPLQSSSVKLALTCLQRSEPSISNTPITINSKQKVDLNSLLADELSIPPPTEIGMTLHWLAVDGISPFAPIVQQQDDTPVHSKQSHHEEGEDDGTPVALRHLLPRLVSDELQLYFRRITDALSSKYQYPEAAITRLANDKCIQELVPFFTQYISRTIHQTINDSEQCRLMIQCTDALIRNPNIHLELHLHQLLGPVLTCIVAKHIGSFTVLSSEENSDREFGDDDDNHWILRDEASDVLSLICSMYGEKYQSLQGSVVKTLCKALGDSSYDSLGSWYGAIVGISKFGVKAIDAFLLPLMGYMSVWEDALNEESIRSNSQPGRYIRVALQRCQEALLCAMAVYLRRMDDLEPFKRLDYAKFSEVFGDRLIPFQSNMDMEYSLCFI